MSRVFRLLSLLALLSVFVPAAPAQTPDQTTQLPANGTGWQAYGGDAGGMRFSQSTQLTRDNVNKLTRAWTFHTHALDKFSTDDGMPSFEATPILAGDTLYFSSPYDVVFALDARTGKERWHYDPKIGRIASGYIIASRGVTFWPLGATPDASAPACSRRIFIGTLDGRLLALDASTGNPCASFGTNGAVNLREGVNFQRDINYYGMTSPPTVLGNVVVCGSFIQDSQQIEMESGMVRGFDATTGKTLWSWEPLPWAAAQKVRTGAGNTWSIISADPALGLVYLPTGAASVDYYGGGRPGDDRDANSIVALEAATGKKVWSFQVVHHDLWDYDIASEPLLFTWRGNSGKESIPAVAVTTKMGMIFLLDRRDGRPLLPVEERPAPQAGVPDDKRSPTQPFQNIPPLAPLTVDLKGPSGFNRSAEDVAICQRQFEGLRYEGIYTAAGTDFSYYYPSNLGGVNWGGAALDPATGILYADTNRQGYRLRLMPRGGHDYYMNKLEHYSDMLLDWTTWIPLVVLVAVILMVRRRTWKPGWPPLIILLFALATNWSFDIYMHYHPAKFPMLDHFGGELSPQRQTPYLIERLPIVDSKGIPCTPAPWGAISAVNLNTQTKLWEKPLGTMIPGEQTGLPNFGGPIVTATGLVITGAAEDRYVRIFDSANGNELTQMPVENPAIATPMTYTLYGRQYIVIAAGGHGDRYAPLGDSLVAFALPQ